MVTFVYDFAQGNKDQKDLLGGKGANLAEMTNLGLPVPPGFTISTEACRAYLEQGREPDGLADEVSDHLKSLEEAMGRSLGDARRPAAGQRAHRREVLDARDDGDGAQRRPQRRVRARAWPRSSDNPRFAHDSYRRLLQMFGGTVMGIEGELFRDALDDLKKDRGHRPPTPTSASRTSRS